MGRYSSGDWYALVTGEGMAMLPSSVAPAVVEQVWMALGQGGGLAAVLDGIVGAFGTGLTSLPPFAVVSRTPDGDGADVAVRGPVEVRMTTRDGEVVVAGLGVTTWSERAVPAVSAIEAGVPGSPVPRLPINDGVVLAGRIAYSFGVGSPSLPAAGPLRTKAPPPGIEDEDGAEGGPEVGLNAGVGEVPDEAPVPDTEEVAHTGETTLAPLPCVPFPDDAELADSDADDYDRLLYGDTVRESVEGAAVRPLEEPEHDVRAEPKGLISGIPGFVPKAPARQSVPDAPAAAAVLPARADSGDHDGETISTAKLRAMQQSAMPPDSPVAAGVAQGGALTTSAAAPITLVLSTGERIVLDHRGAVVGRRPRLVRVQGGNVPHLVTVPSPQQDISRSHLELRVNGSHVLAVDLDTTNGSRLLRPGFDPVRLQPGDPTILVAGDKIDLGDGVELAFEGLR